MSRKGENIFKRKDGRWEGRYIQGYCADGKALYRYIYGKTYREVKEKKIAEIANHNIINTHSLSPVLLKNEKALFDELCKKWLETIKNSVKESTYTRYFRTVYKYILPFFAKYEIRHLSLESINEFKETLVSRGGLRKETISSKSITDILTVLKAVLNYNIEHIPTELDVKKIRLPKKNKPIIKALTYDSQRKLEKMIFELKNETALGVFISLFLGLRIGEVCALRWSDFDLENKVLYIKRTVGRISDLSSSPSKTKLIITEPKTESSARSIPLPSFVYNGLLSYKRRLELMQNEAMSLDDFVVSAKGKACDPHTFYYRYKRLLKEAGVEIYNFHALRHTFATRCVEAGFDAKSLSEILGHKSVTTTLSVYVHPTIKQKQLQMEKLSPLSTIC